MSTTKFDAFMNRYPITRTISMGLEPIGKTMDNIRAERIIETDKELAQAAETVKVICDRAYKHAIDRGLVMARGLGDTKLPNIMQFAELYYAAADTGKDEEEKIKVYLEKAVKSGDSITIKTDEMPKLMTRADALSAYCEAMRGYIVLNIQMANEDIKGMTKPGELLNTYAPKYTETDADIAALERVKKLTTLFTRYCKNRELLFSDKEKQGAVAYRAIDENLPIFLNNALSMITIYNELPDDQLDELERTVCARAGLTLYDLGSIASYGKFLTQGGIDAYNMILGGYTVDQNQKVRGLNEYIYQYNQIHDQKGEKRLPKLKKLDKQMLTDSDGFSFRYAKFNTDRECARAIMAMHKDILENAGKAKDILEKVKAGACDTDAVYISAKNIGTLSSELLGDRNALNDAMETAYNIKNQRDILPERRLNAFDEKRRKYFKKTKVFSIATLNEAMKYVESNPTGTALPTHIGHKLESALLEVKAAYSRVQPILEAMSKINDSALQNKAHDKFVLKEYMDAANDYLRAAKAYVCRDKKVTKDMTFYVDYEELLDVLGSVQTCYNMTRNYATKKPYSADKLALTFSQPRLLGGWDDNKTYDNRGLIFKKGEDVFLGIVTENSKFSRIMKVLNAPAQEGEPVYRMMHYHAVSNAFQQVPHVFFSKNWTNTHPTPDNIARIKRDKTFMVGNENSSAEDLHAMIDFYKDCIAQYGGWDYFHFEFRPTEEYHSIAEFFADIDKASYVTWFDAVSEASVNELVDNGDIYLFRIRNRDLDGKAKGIPDAYTVMFRQMFSDENMETGAIRIKGGAQFFYREASIRPENRIIHRKGEVVANKNPNAYHDKHTMQFDIIKDRRFTEPKFMITIPLQLNPLCPAPSRSTGFYHNISVQQAIRECEKNYIIGISRGIRHLIYATVITEDGEIVEQRSLNIVDSGSAKLPNTTNYGEMLQERSVTREQERKSWDEISNISNLKKGYLSQAVRVVTDLMQKYDAILVMEDLNEEFKNKSVALESNVFRQFERALLTKLSFLYDKKKRPEEVGGLLNAYQLTCETEPHYQSGFVFFVSPYMTAAIDPKTGFVNHFTGDHALRYRNIATAKAFFGKFDDIRYNAEKNYFEFDLHYSNFGIDKDSRDAWTVVTDGTRYKSYRDEKGIWHDSSVDPTSMLIKLFADYDLDYLNGNIMEQIQTYTARDFFERLYECLALTLKLRNSKANTTIDFISSPVLGDDGVRFVSDETDTAMPCCASANCAYNVARKGAMLVKNIKSAGSGEKVRTTVRNAEWLEFAQKGS